MNSKKVIFIGTAEIAGFYTNLNRGLIDLGFNSNYMGMDYYSKKYEIYEHEIFSIKCYKWLKNYANSRDKFIRFILNPLIKLLYFPIFFSILYKVDVLVFGFNSSLFPKKWDFPFWKIFNKQIIVGCFHGSEARPPFMDGVNNLPDGGFVSVNEIKTEIDNKLKQIKKTEKYATYIIGAPTNCQYFSRPLINFFHLGLAVDTSRIAIERMADSIGKGNFTIVHAPSSMVTKGTEVIREAINKLQQKYNLVYIELSGLTVKQVYEQLCKADLVIDQAYSDHPMAGLACEAASLGIPALIAGYELNRIISEFIPIGLVPPTFICEPSNIALIVENLINDKSLLREMGEKARDFVNNQWNFREVSHRYTLIFENNPPCEWFIFPNEIEFVSGAGLSKLKRNKVVLEFIQVFGQNALKLNQINQKKILEEVSCIR